VRNLCPYRVLAAAAAAIPAIAFAHAGMHNSHDLVQGLMHPFGGLDHVLAMVAVGVIAVQLGGRALWVLPLSFVATMAIAGSFGVAGLVLPGIEAGIALSVIVLGAVISLPVRLPVIVAASMVAVFAIFHGYSHGLEMYGVHASAAFGLGFVSATALLHLTGIGLGLVMRRIAVARGQRIVQASGGALMLAGAVLFAAA
jgi:urease accessory protein